MHKISTQVNVKLLLFTKLHSNPLTDSHLLCFMVSLEILTSVHTALLMHRLQLLALLCVCVLGVCVNCVCMFCLYACVFACMTLYVLLHVCVVCMYVFLYIFVVVS